MKSTSIVLVLVLFVCNLVQAAEQVLLSDDYSKLDMSQRRAMRGEWKYSKGVATCTQDDALFKKYQDHGPIIFYDLPLTDAVIRFSIKPQEAKTVVFTANGENGHVFRFVMGSAGTSIRAFPPGDASKSISLAQEKIVLKSGEWVTVEVKLSGSKATVKIGDEPARTYEHASLASPKTNLSIGFSYGTLSVKDFVVVK